jgi:tetratricopeptide (TPR) repeat protein
MFCWVRPYYHRKYVFISLGGWWPLDYSYLRYHWYGWHPYFWYGYYPIARQVGTGTNNYYYTYNYYTGQDGGYANAVYDSGGLASDDMLSAAQLSEPMDEPAGQTAADLRFEAAVESFESGQYVAAATDFALAMELAPGDRIVPFAYAQALFAAEQYTESAEVLREALKQVTSEEPGVFYPRGLYADDETLLAQIETLLNAIDRYGFDGDLQLLLGYNLLGLGEIAYAATPLQRAAADSTNAEAARTLLALLARLESGADAAEPLGGAVTGTIGSATDGRDVGGTAPSEARTGVLERIRGASEAQEANDVSDQLRPDDGVPSLSQLAIKEEDDEMQILDNRGSPSPAL